MNNSADPISAQGSGWHTTWSYLKAGVRSIAASVPVASTVSTFWSELETNSKIKKLEDRLSRFESTQEPKHVEGESPYYYVEGEIVFYSQGCLSLEVQLGKRDILYRLTFTCDAETRFSSKISVGDIVGVSFFLDEDEKFRALAASCRLVGHPQVSAPNLGPPITKITVSGNCLTNEKEIFSAVHLRVGDLVTSKAIERDLQSIYDLGHYTDVRFRTLPRPKGIEFQFLVFERPALNELRFLGNKIVSDEELRSVLSLEQGQPFNPRKLETGVSKINSLYKEKGFLDIASHVTDFDFQSGVLAMTIVEKFKIETVRYSGFLEEFGEKTEEVYLSAHLDLVPGKVLTKKRWESAFHKICDLFREADVIIKEIHPRYETSSKRLTITVTEALLGEVSFSERADLFEKLLGSWCEFKLGHIVRRSDLQDLLSRVGDRSYVNNVQVSRNPSSCEGDGRLGFIVHPEVIPFNQNSDWLDELCAHSSRFDPKNLDDVTNLVLSEAEILQLAPVSRLPNLESLNLDWTQISDLTPLRGLQKLRTLFLSNTQVLDLSPLSLLSLVHLGLNGTGVSDLSPLNTSNLATLAIEHTQISSLDALRDSPRLVYLSFVGTPIRSFEPLMELNIEHLGCSGGSETDFSPVGTLSHLKTLYCKRTPVEDFEFLAGLTNLENLYLSSYPNKECPDLPELESLKAISLYDSAVTKIEGLCHLTNLGEFYLQYSGITDVETLFKFQKLNYVDIRNTGVPIECARELKAAQPSARIRVSDPEHPEKEINL